MTRTLSPIHPLAIPEAVSALRGEAQDCAEAPVAPGLATTRVFPGVVAYAIYAHRHGSACGSNGCLQRGAPIAYTLFTPDEYLTTGSDEDHRSGRGALVTQAVGSPVLDVRDVESSDRLVVARAIRRALPVTADEHALGYHGHASGDPAAPDLDCQHAECIARLTGRPS